MSNFTKRPKLCQDAGVSYEHMNALAENLDSFKYELELEHVPLDQDSDLASVVGPVGLPAGGTGTLDASSVGAGQHDHPLIPRGAAVVYPSVTSGHGVRLFAAAGCLTSMQVLDTGVYFFPISGFARVWGRATAYHPGLGPVQADPPVGEMVAADARVHAATPAGSAGTGLIVKTFKVYKSDGVNEIMAPWHTGFYLWAFGTRDGSVGLAIGGTQPRKASLPPGWPRNPRTSAFRRKR